MPRTLFHTLLIGLGLCAGLPVEAVLAATPPRSTVMLPTRDGVRLATDIYLPAGTGPWTVALVRTPYDRRDFSGSFGSAIPPARFTGSGIALVAQSVRGTGDSQGTYIPFVDDGWSAHQDGVDTVAWIRQQPWANGKIAMYGGSAAGLNQLMLAGTGAEGIIGQYVSAAPISPYRYWFYQNGVWRASSEGWASGWGPTVVPLFRAHPHYDDFWRATDLGTRPDQVHWPIVHMTGWYDLFLQGAIDAFTQLQENGGDGARGRQHLVIGPWVHAAVATSSLTRQEGALTFPPNAVLPRDMATGFAWVSFWLTGQPPIPPDEPAVRYYVMGDVTDPQAPGSVWRTADRWPPPSQPLQLYLTPDGALAAQPPAQASTREYDYDPAHPVPTAGGQEVFISPSGPQDQRRVETRPDVLLFTTPPLAMPLEATGRLSARLYAATSARDTDFTAKLTDVYPDGRSILLADGIVRARYRTSLESETLLTPGQTYAYDIDLWSTSIIFNKGHRIRVAISSSNSPRFELNTNTGGPLPPDPKEKPVVAHQTIFLGGAQASYITLPEVAGSGTP